MIMQTALTRNIWEIGFTRKQNIDTWLVTVYNKNGNAVLFTSARPGIASRTKGEKLVAISTLHERIHQEIEQLSDEQLRELLLFIEYLNIREDREFIEYVNGRTQQALDARKKGKKFQSLEELQRKFCFI